MLDISILTVVYNETCIVIRKSSHVRDIDSDCCCYTRPASLLDRAVMLEISILTVLSIRDLHRY